MIEISKPYIYRHNDKSRLEASIINSKQNREYKIWYEVDEKYASFLCDELADAFLLAILPLACIEEQDIHIHASISPKLFHNTLNIHIPFYSAFFQKKKILLTADQITPFNFDGKAIATGCSLGVDSLSTILQHMGDNAASEEKLTHLALFNSCQLGDKDQESLDAAFDEKCKDVEAFSKEVGLDCVFVNSNITSLMSGANLRPTYLFHYFTASCVLAIQKLFCKYYISSSYDASHVCIERTDLSHTEAVFVPMLGNENTEIILSDAFTSRTEKTKRLLQSNLTPKYLDVCTAIQNYNMNGGASCYQENKTKKNCGWCEKCIRTLFTIELLGGDLSEYKDTFDLNNYYQFKEDFIIKVVAQEKLSVFFHEIYELMKETKYPIPKKAYVVKALYASNRKLFRGSWQKYMELKHKIIHK